jgi:hypothetical protein
MSPDIVQALYDMDGGQAFHLVSDLADTANVTCPILYPISSNPVCSSSGMLFVRATVAVQDFLNSMVSARKYFSSNL